jgi:TolA-binding protein
VSDRRSFSEIPQELLRDHAVDAKVERVWHRLQKDLDSAKVPPRRLEGHRGALAFAVITFTLGVFVGTRWSEDRSSTPIAAMGEEPALPRTTEVPHAEMPLPLLPGAAPTITRPARHVSSRHPFALAQPEPTTVEDPPNEAPPPAIDWPRLADEGQYQKALTSIEDNGGFDAALANANADQLMSLVDVTRATGQRDKGVLALRRIVGVYPGDPNAAVAAWMLANELAKSRDLAGAEAAFATYRALSPSGDFAEDALARQVDMAAEQGSQDRAKKLAGQYLKEFPDGPRSADIQALLERWSRVVSTEIEAPLVSAAVAADAGAPR